MPQGWIFCIFLSHVPAPGGLEFYRPPPDYSYSSYSYGYPPPPQSESQWDSAQLCYGKNVGWAAWLPAGGPSDQIPFFLDALDPVREVTGNSGGGKHGPNSPRFPAELTYKWIHWSIHSNHSQVRLPSAHAPTAGLWSVWRAAARPATSGNALWSWETLDGGWWRLMG